MQKTYRETLTKSIKLEAVPTEATKRAILKDDLMQYDQALDMNAKAIVPVIDDFVKSIISSSLNCVMADFENMYVLRKSEKADDQKAYVKAQDECKKNLVKTISKTLPEGLSKIMDINSAKLLDPALLNFIESNPNYSIADKMIYKDLVANLKGCMPKLTKYTRTRVTTLEVWVPERMMENFEIYCDNIALLNSFVNAKTTEEQQYLKDHPELLTITLPSYYEYSCTPESIQAYNSLINGIYDEKTQTMTKGYNAFINELNMQRQTDKEYTGAFYKKLKPLYQQILFPKEKAFTIDKINDDKELAELLSQINARIPKTELFRFINFFHAANPDDMLVNGKDIHTLSALATKDHQNLVNKVLDYEYQAATNRKDKKAMNNISKYVANKTYSFEVLENITNVDLKSVYVNTLIALHTSISRYTTTMQGFEIFSGKAKIYNDTRNKKLVKDYLEALCEFDRYLRMILKNAKNDDANIIFYNQLEDLHIIFNDFNTAYNKSRNYLTQTIHDFATETQICFGNAAKYNTKWLNDTKLKNEMNSIVRMDGKYYFVTINPRSVKRSIDLQTPKDNMSAVDMFFQKTFQKAANTFTKRVFKDSGAADFFTHNPLETEFIISENMINPVRVLRSDYAIYRDGLARKPAIKEGLITAEEFKQNVTSLIRLYQEYAINCIAMKEFTFRFKKAEEYEDLNDFYTSVDKDLYVPKWISVDRAQIEGCIEDGTLLAFLITNMHMYKDDCSQTTYAQTFLYLMSDDNFKTRTMRLNANPALFFRPACLNYHCTHKKGSILVNKKTVDGDFIPGSIYKEIYNFYNGYLDTDKKKAAVTDLSKEAQTLINNKQISTRIADYDLIKYKRYMEDKYFISFSYKKNAQIDTVRNNTITDEVREEIRQQKMNTLVITRGITDLLFYTLFDTEGHVIEEKSLNVINGVDYQNRLHALTYDRNNAKTNEWDYSKVCQNYKISYLNFAIAELTKIAIENNAVIVVEKVSDRFKDKMSCFDNQVLKSFENKLEAKLLDYYNKHNKVGEDGSLSNPIQLVRSFDRVMHPTQNGILFRINAAHTSNMDSKTHFVNLLPLADQRTLKQKRMFLSLFDHIQLEDDLVKFTFDYNKFNLDKVPERAIWTIYAGKSMSVWDVEHKHFKWLNKPFTDVTEAIVEAGLQNRNLALEKDLPDKLVIGLFAMLDTCLRKAIIRNGKDFENSLYSSPVSYTYAPISASVNATRNLYYKFQYYLSDDNEKNGDFELNWINYAQALEMA